MDDFELEIKKLIVTVLRLEEIQPDEISSDEPLFGNGLGLDSIDALELGVAIRKKYGIKIGTITDEVKAHFGSVGSLARFIQAQRGDGTNVDG